MFAALHFGNYLKVSCEVVFLFEYLLPMVAPSYYMIKWSLKLCPRFPRHAWRTSIIPWNVNRQVWPHGYSFISSRSSEDLRAMYQVRHSGSSGIFLKNNPLIPFSFAWENPPECGKGESERCPEMHIALLFAIWRTPVAWLRKDCGSCNVKL